MDCAASEFYKDGKYVLAGEGNKAFTSEEFTHFLEDLTKQYPIVSIEDGLDESDWAGFKYQTEVLGDKIQLVGDDLFVTNTKILKEGIEKGVANSILIKFNQIGSLTETLAAIKMAKTQVTPRLSLTVQVKPKMRLSLTWQSVPQQAKSKPVL